MTPDMTRVANILAWEFLFSNSKKSLAGGDGTAELREFTFTPTVIREISGSSLKRFATSLHSSRQYFPEQNG
jgi:hypothetical protein